MEPNGTIHFSTIGVASYGFDVFSVPLPTDITSFSHLSESRLTDGTSVNFNGQFIDDNNAVAFVSERSGSSRLYSIRPENPLPESLPTAPESLFHDRPSVKNNRLFFMSAHEPPLETFKSWSAVYTCQLDGKRIDRLTPPGSVDFSPAVSQSGNLVAVASYGSRPWKGDFHDLDTDIVVFKQSDYARRTFVSNPGGWPAWAGDSTVFFHRLVDDGWWSIFRVDLTEDLVPRAAMRITPPGLHAFTPAVSHDGKWIAVGTRRPGREFRHIEIFDLETERFYPITELINPRIHHYNPFLSPGSSNLGYHRFRGESATGDSVIPHIQPVACPVKGLRMLRHHGNFPSSSPIGGLIAINGDFVKSPGLMILKSDGSKRWTLLKERISFYTMWSPAEKGVLFTSVGGIFLSAKETVQIARLSFDPNDLVDQQDTVPADVKILTREDTGNNAFPSCSPDGKWVVFRSGRSGRKNLYVVDATNGEHEGQEIRQLTDGDWIDTMPCWSPDGKLIAFSSNRHNPSDPVAFSIYLIRPDGTGLRRVYVAGPEGSSDVNRERINHVCFSPDCSWLLFTANLGSVSAEPVSMPNQFQPYGDLFICRLDGSGVKRLTCNGYENGTPTWHSDCEAMVDVGRLSLLDPAGDKLTGQFQEPLWITCPIAR